MNQASALAAVAACAALAALFGPFALAPEVEMPPRPDAAAVALPVRGGNAPDTASELRQAEPAPTPADRGDHAATAPVDAASSVQALLAQIDHGDSSPDLVRALRDLFVLSPALLATVQDQLGAGALGERAAVRLLQALELTADGPCQAVLAAVSGDGRCEPGLRRRALASLGNVPEPTTASLGVLWSAFQNGDVAESRTALLAFGRAATALRGRDEAAYAEARTQLGSALQLTAADATATVLQAMATTGDPSFVPAIEPLLTASSPAIRAAAARALASTGGAAVETRLVHALALEPVAEVRRELVRALLAVPQPSQRSLAEAAAAVLAERDAPTRRLLAQLLQHERG